MYYWLSKFTRREMIPSSVHTPSDHLYFSIHCIDKIDWPQYYTLNNIRWRLLWVAMLNLSSISLSFLWLFFFSWNFRRIWREIPCGQRKFWSILFMSTHFHTSFIHSLLPTFDLSLLLIDDPHLIYNNPRYHIIVIIWSQRDRPTLSPSPATDPVLDEWWLSFFPWSPDFIFCTLYTRSIDDMIVII